MFNTFNRCAVADAREGISREFQERQRTFSPFPLCYPLVPKIFEMFNTFNRCAVVGTREGISHEFQERPVSRLPTLLPSCA
jgi:hypothetical protein